MTKRFALLALAALASHESPKGRSAERSVCDRNASPANGYRLLESKPPLPPASAVCTAPPVTGKLEELVDPAR